jgi:lipopolysaccharide export LptBFGC system permease protein LptF
MPRLRPAALRRESALLVESNGDPMKPHSGFGAIVLIVLGALFLLSNLGVIPRLGPLFATWWPLILILVGASLLLRRR